jgi:hypothetical protein
MTKLTLDPAIIAAFSAHSIELEHRPELNEGRGLWQYDDGPDGAIIELWVGINGTGNVGVFGTYDAGDFGQQYGLSSNMSDWIENFAQYLPFMAKGEEFDW